MRISIDKKSNAPLYTQIKNQIRDLIYAKTLPINFVLPSERELADKIKVNRSTVAKAYEELKAEGIITSAVGKGTYVIYEKEKEEISKYKNNETFYWDDIYNENSKKNFDDSISEIFSNNKNDTIRFSGGFSSPELFPTEEFKNINKALLENYEEELFLHGEVEGYLPLRKEIKKLVGNRGINALIKEIMISSGRQQALDLIVRTFVNKDDVIIVGEPSFFGAGELFRAVGAKVIGVPLDESGIKMEVLEYQINKKKPKFIYTNPTFQNPTGITLSFDRRKELLNLAYKLNIPIIEDDTYGELRYEGNEIPSLKAIDTREQVIYISSFSKVISIGLRVGFIVAPERVINKLLLLKQITDVHVNTLTQKMVYEFLRQGYFEKHLMKIREEYKIKMNLMIDEIKLNLDEELSFTKPMGGSYLWCKLSDNINPKALMKATIKNGVSYVPGELFYIKGSKRDNYIRLNFTYPNREEILEGIKRLKKSIEETKIIK